ncbi:MAG: hypothetical protein GY847_03480 [Proteobacteria bacterium]|nr:hypothetical protein [Pseudomonadota bacterium]
MKIEVLLKMKGVDLLSEYLKESEVDRADKIQAILQLKHAEAINRHNVVIVMLTVVIAFAAVFQVYTSFSESASMCSSKEMTCPVGGVEEEDSGGVIAEPSMN